MKTQYLIIVALLAVLSAIGLLNLAEPVPFLASLKGPTNIPIACTFPVTETSTTSASAALTSARTEAKDCLDAKQAACTPPNFFYPLPSALDAQGRVRTPLVRGTRDAVCTTNSTSVVTPARTVNGRRVSAVTTWTTTINCPTQCAPQITIPSNGLPLASVPTTGVCSHRGSQDANAAATEDNATLAVNNWIDVNCMNAKKNACEGNPIRGTFSKTCTSSNPIPPNPGSGRFGSFNITLTCNWICTPPAAGAGANNGNGEGTTTTAQNTPKATPKASSNPTYNAGLNPTPSSNPATNT